MDYSSIEHADDYPFGQTPGTGASYLVNDASLSIGDTVIACDTGTGTILIGDKVTLAGDSKAYTVSVALSGGSFTISEALEQNIADNAAITVGPTWIDVGDWLDEDFEPGVESPVSTRMGEGGEEQDLVELQGTHLCYGTPAVPGVRTWFRLTATDTDGTVIKKVVGGTKGCRVKVGHSNVRPPGQGKAYKRVEYSATAGAPGGTIETDRTA